MRVLIVEDDPAMANIIRLTLEAENYECELADLGRDGLKAAKSSEFDIIILDLMLPDIGGYEVLSKLRVARIHAPVLILSGFAEVDDGKMKKSIGMSDFLAKPFNRQNLVDRVHGLITTAAAAPKTVIRTGKVNVNISTGTVDVGGSPVALSEKEFRILELLSLRKGKIIPKANFLIHLYDTVDIPGDPSIIDRFIETIRKKLSWAANCEFYIDAIPDRGYVLCDPIPADLVNYTSRSVGGRRLAMN